MGRFVHTLTQKQLDGIINQRLQEQANEFQNILDNALNEQIKIDSAYNYKYFYTVTFYVLNKIFGFGKTRLLKLWDALNDTLDDPPDYNEIVKTVNDLVDLEIAEASEANLREMK